ncbi:unnamed protein product [Effrenium voratum]|nr:unnamed protein product [Effrenium voratum]
MNGDTVDGRNPPWHDGLTPLGQAIQEVLGHPMCHFRSFPGADYAEKSLGQQKVELFAFSAHVDGCKLHFAITLNPWLKPCAGIYGGNHPCGVSGVVRNGFRPPVGLKVQFLGPAWTSRRALARYVQDMQITGRYNVEAW